MISAINYITDYCNNARIAVRIDDDVIFNPLHMVQQIVRYFNQEHSITYNISESYHTDVQGDEEIHYREGFGITTTPAAPGDTLLDNGWKPASNYSFFTSLNVAADAGLLTKLSIIRNNTIACHILHHRIGRAGVYKLDPKFLPNETQFPEYCAGFFIAFTMDLLPKIRRMFHLEPPFWIDDAYLGVLMKRLLTVNVTLKRRLKFSPPANENIKTVLTSNPSQGPIAIHLNQKNFYKTLGEAELLLRWYY